MLGGEVNSSLTCPNPSFNVCCCDDGGGSPPPPECENRGGECVLTSDCCTGLTCYQITGGPIPTPSGKVCCNPSLNRLDGDSCLCPAECRNNNCFHLFCGGPPSPPPAVCGNGVLEVGEQCDDGNIVNGDGCSSTCISEGGGLPPNGNGGVDWQIGGNGGIIDLKSPLGCTTIEECIGRMINFLFSLAVILTPLMIILAGFLYITAVGKPEKIVQAQKLITWTLIGFLIVSLARAIIYVITSVIGG
jgi:cysteine-rich repeat protein